MPVVIEDATPDLLAFWSHAEGRPPAEQAALWHERYATPHRALLTASGGRHGGPDELAPALARFPHVVPRIGENAPRLRTAIDRVGLDLARRFAVEEMDLRWALLVGLFWSDGWFALVDGVPTCFLAVELTEHVRLAEVAIAHEAAHALHRACTPGGLDDLAQVGDLLYIEGLAVLASTQVVPGVSEGSHLWPGRSETVDGEDVAARVAVCEAAWPDLRARLLRDLTSTDWDTDAAYFPGDRAEHGLPMRSGYFADYRLVAALADGRPLAEMARWPATRIRHEMATILDRTQTCPPPALASSCVGPPARR